MTDSDAVDNSAPANADDLPDPLVKWERTFALTIGVICGGAGGYAVFEKSNQAGTVMLLILAAIFLLIGIQGTPLIKFGSSSGSVELERRRRRKVQEALEQASEENNTAKAEGIVEGLKLVAPDLVPDSFSTYKQYEDSVAYALLKMGYEVSQNARVRQVEIDLQIKKNDHTAYAELKYYMRPISSQIIQQVIGKATIVSAPVLLVANTQLTNSAQTLIGHGIVDFVQWRNESDSPALQAAVERLLANVNRDDGDASKPNGSV